MHTTLIWQLPVLDDRGVMMFAMPNDCHHHLRPQVTRRHELERPAGGEPRPTDHFSVVALTETVSKCQPLVVFVARGFDAPCPSLALPGLGHQRDGFSKCLVRAHELNSVLVRGVAVIAE